MESNQNLCVQSLDRVGGAGIETGGKRFCRDGNHIAARCYIRRFWDDYLQSTTIVDAYNLREAKIQCCHDHACGVSRDAC